MKKFLLLFLFSFFFLFVPIVVVFGQVGKCGGVSSCVYMIAGIQTKTYCSVQCNSNEIPAPVCSGCPNSPCECKCVEEPRCKTFTLPPTTPSAPRHLEIQYPTVPGATPPTTTGTEVPDYIKYIYNFFIWIAGFIALIVLVIAGFRYMTSAGRPEVMKDAKDQIFAALAGLLILMSSWLLLFKINPQLINLKFKKPPIVSPVLSPGVYLCNDWVNIRDNSEPGVLTLIKNLKDLSPDDPQIEQLVAQINAYLNDIKEKCCVIPNKQEEIDKKCNNTAKYIYVVPSETNRRYGAVFYEESKYGGKAQVVYTLEPVAEAFEVKNKPSSIRPFVFEEPRPGSYVEIYELSNLNIKDPENKKKKEKYNVDPPYVPVYENVSGFSQIGSVKIEPSPGLFVIFFKEAQSGDWQAEAELDVIINTDTDLSNNLMRTWCQRGLFGLAGEIEYYPCAKNMVIVNGMIQ